MVDREFDDWDEKRLNGRTRKWFSIDEAKIELEKHKPIQATYLNLLKGNTTTIAANTMIIKSSIYDELSQLAIEKKESEEFQQKIKQQQQQLQQPSSSSGEPVPPTSPDGSSVALNNLSTMTTTTTTKTTQNNNYLIELNDMNATRDAVATVDNHTNNHHQHNHHSNIKAQKIFP